MAHCIRCACTGKRVRAPPPAGARPTGASPESIYECVPEPCRSRQNSESKSRPFRMLELSSVGDCDGETAGGGEQ